MIDWITAELPCLHTPLHGGVVCKTDREGVIEWETSCFLSSVGSFEAKMQYRSSGGDGEGRATHLLISGNPAKFFQGHNAFGSDDLIGLVYDVYSSICELERLEPGAASRREVALGEYRLRRIDITQSFALPSRADVRAWLRAAEYCSRNRAGRPAASGTTLYWGKKSQRWSIKAYCKGDELDTRKKGHELPLQLQGTPIKDWADNKLRIELTLRGKELDELGVNSAKLLKGQIEALYQTYLSRLTMTGQIKLSEADRQKLPRPLALTYTLWLEGHDLRSVLPKATYYRHRIALLEQHNIDIALSRENSGQSNVVPLIRVLQAEPVSIPDWAFELGLFHVPTRHLAPCVAAVT